MYSVLILVSMYFIDCLCALGRKFNVKYSTVVLNCHWVRFPRKLYQLQEFLVAVSSLPANQTSFSATVRISYWLVVDQTYFLTHSSCFLLTSGSSQ